MPLVSGHSLPQARAEIAAHLEAGWTSSTSLRWVNVGFDPDAEGTPKDVGFVRSKYAPGDSVRVGLLQGDGRRKHRQFGVWLVDIFWPLLEGEGGAWDLVAEVADLLDGKTLAGVRFRSFDTLGSEEGEHFFQVSCSAEFHYDYFRT